MEFQYHPILLGSGHHYRVHVLSENTAKKGLNFRLFAAKRKISIHPIKTTRSNCLIFLYPSNATSFLSFFPSVLYPPCPASRIKEGRREGGKRRRNLEEEKVNEGRGSGGEGRRGKGDSAWELNIRKTE